MQHHDVKVGRQRKTDSRLFEVVVLVNKEVTLVDKQITDAILESIMSACVPPKRQEDGLNESN